MDDPAQDTNAANIEPTSTFEYDLLNTTILERLKYAEREYGINLVWAQPDPGAPAAIRFERANGASGPIRFGEIVAIAVRDGGFLRYGEREYGINLKWSDTPAFEWRLRATAVVADNPVNTSDIVGLFNTVAGDYLFYDPRRFGINLKWLRDEGKFNGTPWYERVGTLLWGLGRQLISVIRELVNRIVGIVDFILTLLDIMLPKRIRIRFVILRNHSGEALLGDENLPDAVRQAQLQRIDDAVALMREIFRKQVNTRVRAAGGKMVETLRFPAPVSALDPRCGGRAFMEEFVEVGAYFRRHAASSQAGRWLGYGAPVTIFIVHDVDGKAGCSLGPLTDYVTVDLSGMSILSGAREPRPSTPAHEIGHACFLVFHRKRKANLMYRSRAERGFDLTRWQKAVFRSSRHVTLLVGTRGEITEGD